VGKGALDPDSAHPFRAEVELAAPARLHSSLPGYEPAAIIERVTPRYSLEARAQHLQGTVRIRAVIGKDGVPRRLARVSGDPLLAQIAMDAVALWRYAPATLDGQPVGSEVIIPIDFHLPD
jgi:protein TonB